MGWWQWWPLEAFPTFDRRHQVTLPLKAMADFNVAPRVWCHLNVALAAERHKTNVALSLGMHLRNWKKYQELERAHCLIETKGFVWPKTATRLCSLKHITLLMLSFCQPAGALTYLSLGVSFYKILVPDRCKSTVGAL